MELIANPSRLYTFDMTYQNFQTHLGIVINRYPDEYTLLNQSDANYRVLYNPSSNENPERKSYLIDLRIIGTDPPSVHFEGSNDKGGIVGYGEAQQASKSIDTLIKLIERSSSGVLTRLDKEKQQAKNRVNIQTIVISVIVILSMLYALTVLL